MSGGACFAAATGALQFVSLSGAPWKFQLCVPAGLLEPGRRAYLQGCTALEQSVYHTMY